jgi:hypothetical protein
MTVSNLLLSLHIAAKSAITYRWRILHGSGVVLGSVFILHSCWVG